MRAAGPSWHKHPKGPVGLADGRQNEKLGFVCDPFPSNYSYDFTSNLGVGRTVGWDTGLSVVFFDTGTSKVFVATLRTQ